MQVVSECDMKRSRFVYYCLALAIIVLFLVLLYNNRLNHKLISAIQPRRNEVLYSESEWSTPIQMNEHTILVYIHIQKTGGSHFLAHLVSSTRNDKPLCSRPSLKYKNKLKRKRDIVVCPIHSFSEDDNQLPEMWLASEKTYGWVCGLHPFLMEMKDCIPVYYRENYGPRHREFHYITLLRHPVLRYISEYLHVQRGATWFYEHVCGKEVLGANVMKPCYSGYYKGWSWEGLNLSKFMHCPTNWANNRQTLMLADLKSATNCLSNATNLSHRELDERMLNSAKENIAKMSFFGISEYMYESGELYKYRFSLSLANPPKQKKLESLHSSEILYSIWTNSTLYNHIVHINRLDMQLYHFALQLFSERLQKLNITIDENKLDKEIITLKDNIRRSRRRHVSI